jgi:hypothetical protein
MQTAIVPYNPPTGCSARAAHQRTFASFVQNGGRVEPIDLGARKTADIESAPLLPKREQSEALSIMKSSNRQHRITQFAVVCALLFAVVVFAGLGVVVWRVNDNVEQFEALIAPHASLIVNTTVETLRDIGATSSNMHDISGYTAELASVAGGTTGMASDTLNSTAAIAHKLADFMKHPTIQLSLGGT